MSKLIILRQPNPKAS